MNRRTLLLFCLLIIGNITAQNILKTDTIAKRNEISFNTSPLLSLFTSGKLSETAFSFGYAHNFGKNHFLRTGVKFIPVIERERLTTIEEAKLYSGYIFWNSGDDTSSVVDTVTSVNSQSNELRASVYLGYEHLFGKRKVKFLLGMDVLLGFTKYESSQVLTNYHTIYKPDTVNHVYGANYQLLNEMNASVNTYILHTGFAPRLGIRYDVTKTIAFTMVYTPLFYIDMRGHSYTTMSDKPALFFYGIPALGELGLVVKMK